MSIKRQIRVELKGLSLNWDDSFVLVYSKGINELLQIQKEERKSKKEIKMINRALEELRQQIENAKPEELEALLSKEEQMEEGLDKLHEETIEKLRAIVADSFIDGYIYDDEVKATRQMTKEEIKDFDTEVLGLIVNSMVGVAQKKTS